MSLKHKAPSHLKWLLDGGIWLFPKMPLIVAAIYAAYQGIVSNWGSAQPPEDNIRAIFALLVCWLTSEGLEVIANRWRNTTDQINSRLVRFEEALNSRLDELQSQWGRPTVGADHIVREISTVIRAGTNELRLAHLLNHSDLAVIHRRLQSCIISIERERRKSHYHLWKIDSEETLTSLECFARECAKKEDRGSWVGVLPPGTNGPNVELVLLNDREAFVIVPLEEPPGECMAYHLLGRDTVEPLSKLWDGWWRSAAEIESPRGMNEENLKKLYLQLSPPEPHQSADILQRSVDNGSLADLMQTLQNLVLAPPGTLLQVDEIRTSSATTLEQYQKYDMAIDEALQSGRIRYRRVQVVIRDEELSTIEAFVKKHAGRALSVFVSLRQPVQPWSCWVIRPGRTAGTIVYLRCSADPVGPSNGFLALSQPELVDVLREYVDGWWADRPRNRTNMYGLLCDNGSIDFNWLTVWHNELMGRSA
ncbi:hypothetical protein TFLX_04000 [Thermoflexales bacterium]|nr:hypothetical protein TFLX_04000 [Thermoflexales bacterium]